MTKHRGNDELLARKPTLLFKCEMPPHRAAFFTMSPRTRSGVCHSGGAKPALSCPLLHSAKNYCIFIHDSIRPADLAFVPGRLFNYLLDADLPLFTRQANNLRQHTPYGETGPLAINVEHRLPSNTPFGRKTLSQQVCKRTRTYSVFNGALRKFL